MVAGDIFCLRAFVFVHIGVCQRQEDFRLIVDLANKLYYIVFSIVTMIVMIVMIVIRRCVVLCEPGSTLLEVGLKIDSFWSFSHSTRAKIFFMYYFLA